MAIQRIRIKSPMAWGNGAFVVHRVLERRLPGYHVIPYHPNWTLFPFLLSQHAAPSQVADLIHTAAAYAGFFYHESVPLVITFHNYVLDHWMAPYTSFFKRAYHKTFLRMWTRRALNCASAVTAVSHYTANLVRKDMPTSIPIQVIYNGIDTNHFSPPPIQRNNQKEIRVFFSGNLTLRKGAKWLPAIAGRLQPNIRIYYTLGLRTRNRITKEGPLTSVGSVSLQDMPQRYREMDILLMPTVREGFGLSIAEAMSCGLPVVASDCSAIPELVDDGLGGFLCPVGDVDSFFNS